MFNTRQTILASRPAATVLALVLVAGLTAPFLMLPRANAASDPPPPCTEGNNNGCTELSPTPPQDTPAVPPNIMLMLDDSGSMEYDYMPDFDYLAVQNQFGQRNPSVNGVYYNPGTTYAPPPKADGTLYPDSSFPQAFRDGFTNTSTVDVRSYTANNVADLYHQFPYGINLPTTLINYTDHDYGPATWGGGSPGTPGSPGVPAHCGGGTPPYYQDPGNTNQCIRSPAATIGEIWTCNSGDTYYASHGGRDNQCRHRVPTEHGWDDTWYDATDGGPRCPSGSTYNSSDGLCHYPVQPWIPATDPTPPTDPIPNWKWVCASGTPTPSGAPPPPSAPPECVSTTGSRVYVYAFMYTVGTIANPTLSDQAHTHFVIPNGPDAPADGWCAHLYPGTPPYTWNSYHMDTAHCVDADDTSGTAAPSGVAAGQNIANWFSYYRTRMLMAKSSLMTAFLNLDSKYRFGFASINGNGKSEILGPEYPAAGSSASVPYVTFDDSGGFGGDSNNRLAVVQPYGEGSDSTSQKAKFWNWIANESPSNATPLRKALQAVGEYYKTDQPWLTMPGDPGYTEGSDTKFACRASFTILTTDGFWNGGDPSGIGYAAGVDGPVQTVPAGNVTQYLAQPPFSGGGVGGSVPSLADVATYYWENDLRSDYANEVSAGASDPASWQHMTTFTIGLGFTPTGIAGTDAGGNAVTIPEIFAWAQGLGPAITGFGWPTPSSNNLNNIADLAHAAVNGHGSFFNAKNPADLATAFALIVRQIAERTEVPTPAGVNASVLSLGAMSFSTGYTTGDWSGNFWGVALKTDGTIGDILWKAEAALNSSFHGAGYGSRKVFSDAYQVTAGVGTFSTFQLTNDTTLDDTEIAGLQSPTLSGADDTINHRIAYLLGDNTYETSGLYRTRANILGAILRSAPVYVAGATGNYNDSWPTFGGISPPETAAGNQSYDAFVTQQSTQAGMVYVGANDGMLHAFNAPVPSCTGTVDSDGNCTAYTSATGAGTEAWAFVPRAVYANLGNLTSLGDFQFRPTVDGTPVRRDVYFSGDQKWHTLLAGGVGLGGRGVYALDVTDPGSFTASDVLWEFDSDMPIPSSDNCKSIQGSSADSIGCRATDLGYTISQPNIGRLANGKWVVLVPNGYFPDCYTPDIPTKDQASCQTIAAEVPKDSDGKPYSALFVLDAATGKAIAELKTPTDISGVTSFGLATPVLGDYQSDQVDDVAFAGDVQGNLWRFDLSDSSPTNWTVTLVYKGLSADGHQGIQPITTMPRLFPDSTTNRFMVLFGTGKFLGVGDNSNSTVQALMGVRDVVGTTYDQSELTQQYLHEFVEPPLLPDGVTPNPLAGETVRCVTGSSANDCTNSAAAINDVPSTSGGWFINLTTTTSGGVRNDAGERVVVNPGAIFSTNTVIIETLITGSQSSDACNPTTAGAIMALNASTGAPSGISALGGWPIAGMRIDNARTSGSVPVASGMGGGRGYIPGVSKWFAPDLPAWRRRSWQEIKPNP